MFARAQKRANERERKIIKVGRRNFLSFAAGKRNKLFFFSSNIINFFSRQNYQLLLQMFLHFFLLSSATFLSEFKLKSTKDSLQTSGGKKKRKALIIVQPIIVELLWWRVHIKRFMLLMLVE